MDDVLLSTIFLGGGDFLGVSMPQIWGQHADVATLNTSSFPSNSGRNDAVEVCNRPMPSRHVLQHLPKFGTQSENPHGWFIYLVETSLLSLFYIIS